MPVVARAVAEEDHVSWQVAAGWWVGPDATDNAWPDGGRLGVRKEAVRVPLIDRGASDVEARLSHRPPDEHRAVTRRPRRLVRLHPRDAHSAVGGCSLAVGVT